MVLSLTSNPKFGLIRELSPSLDNEEGRKLIDRALEIKIRNERTKAMLLHFYTRGSSSESIPVAVEPKYWHLNISRDSFLGKHLGELYDQVRLNDAPGNLDSTLLWIEDEPDRPDATRIIRLFQELQDALKKAVQAFNAKSFLEKRKIPASGEHNKIYFLMEASSPELMPRFKETMLDIYERSQATGPVKLTSVEKLLWQEEGQDAIVLAEEQRKRNSRL